MSEQEQIEELRQLEFILTLCKNNNYTASTIADILIRKGYRKSPLVPIDEKNISDFLKKQEVYLGNYPDDLNDKETLEQTIGTLQVERIGKQLCQRLGTKPIPSVEIISLILKLHYEEESKTPFTTEWLRKSPEERYTSSANKVHNLLTGGKE